MEIEPSQLLGAAGGLGVILGAAWVAAYVFGWIWAWAWAWIDDCSAPNQSPLIKFAMTKMGWTTGDKWSCFPYKKGEDGRSDGACGFFFPLIAICIAPTAVVLLTLLYQLTLSVLLAVLLARLARFARRHKKLFDKHLKDPEAHK